MTKPGQTSVVATSTEPLLVEQRQSRRLAVRRLDRRLARTAIGVALLLLCSFCGTGMAVNLERAHQRALHTEWLSTVAEYDCCYSAPLPEACQEALGSLRELAELVRVQPTWAERAASWWTSALGIEPMLWDVRAPDPTTVNEQLARCDAVTR